MKSLLFRSLIVLGMLGLVACQSAQSSKASAPAKKAAKAPAAKLLITPQAAVDLGYSTAWHQAVNASNADPVTATSVLDDKMLVVIQGASRVITAIDINNGSVIWKKRIERSGNLYPASKLEEYILVNNEAEAFLLNEQTGEIVNIIKLPHVSSTGATIIDDRAIFGTITGLVYSMDLLRNIELWGYKFHSEIKAPIAQADQSLVIADIRGIFGKVSGLDGTMLFREKTFGPIVAKPAVNDLSIFIASEDQFVYALNRTDGVEQWKRPFGTPLKHDPMAIGLSVYLPVNGDGLYALDALTGEIKWKKNSSIYAITGDDNSVLVAQPNVLAVLDAKTGDILRAAPAHRILKATPLKDDNLILIGRNGDIIKLNKR
ncbi:Serine/threonine-protein kinase AfsK [Poriferisphaera corsica]|uniref:Serine/threonine-protein kinase AfsK n=1 Tax=Poriferisphaera corsica TaxID=2528020 RepID=A0A517YSW7_9BACT|nr:PQQ-binding-like beta-propeller repeat protein [Poriferisphaera corsica]QDU33333.1 Serine/threonine-protein kinase AfsK [Poriferisphaera corsica]